ncbi:MAG: hypothetical protein ACTSWA_03380, partial [Candidatus Thorarchaeota archaeon]
MYDDEDRFEIRLKSETGEEFVVSFSNPEDSMKSIDALLRVKGAFEKRDSILQIKTLCQTDDERVYFPKDGLDLPKARWVSVAAAASFPVGIPVTLITTKTSLKPNEISAYCTSKNNPTSRYLCMEGGPVFIFPEGIDWVLGLLKKDSQI